MSLTSLQESLSPLERPGLNSLAKVLIVDSEKEEREQLHKHLQGAGYDVSSVDSADAALQALESFKPSCVLCDLQVTLPEHGSMVEYIAKDAAETPIIVLSREGSMVDVVNALRVGASDFIMKPVVDLEVLEHAIERSMERYSLRQENLRYRAKLEKANTELKNNLAVLEQDQQAGLLVQMKMLPANPMQKRAYVFRHQMVPSLYLSGDFVEHVTVGSDHVVFFVADVSGHGASSAFVTVLLKNLTARLRSDFGRVEDETVLHPAQFLLKANDELLDTGIGKHATLFYAVLDVQSNSLCYSVAGHLPLPILVTKEGSRYLEGIGAPVGLFPDTEYQEHNIQLPGEFQLVLFSDGILEVLDRSSLAEKEALLLEKASEFKSDPESVLRCLGIDSAQRYPDDIALLLLEKN